MLATLRHLVEAVALYASLTLLGRVSLPLVLLALPLWSVLSVRYGARCTCGATLLGSRAYVRTRRLMGAYRLDLRALSAPRSGPPLVFAPGYSSFVEALFVVAYNPYIACGMKPSLMNNIVRSTGARLVCLFRNGPARQMITSTVEALACGASALLSPDGTTTVRAPINPLDGSVAIVARHPSVPVPTPTIEPAGALFSRRWSRLECRRLLTSCRVRLGRRFEPATDPRALTDGLAPFSCRLRTAAAHDRWTRHRGARRPEG